MGNPSNVANEIEKINTRVSEWLDQFNDGLITEQELRNHVMTEMSAALDHLVNMKLEEP